MKRGSKSSLVLLLVLIVLTACGSSSSEKKTVHSTSKEVAKNHLLIAAAASLESVMEKEIIPAFEKKHPEVTIEGNYDSSGKLQAQIEKGLEADLFFSAATKQMEALVSQNFIDESKVIPLLQNKLVLIVPSSSQENISAFSDLPKVEMVAIGDPVSVPAGQYAQQALQQLGYWDELKDHTSLGTNVTEVLNWVAAGSAQAGLVYATDALGNKQVKIVAELPEDALTEPIIYPVAPLKNTQEKKITTEFLAFLESKEVANYFKKAGFTLKSD